MVAFKVNDLEFQGHVIEIENSNYHLWIPLPRNYTHEKFHEEIRSGRPKSRGVATTPPPWLQTLIEIAWLYAG